jgi:hypothetical protein
MGLTMEGLIAARYQDLDGRRTETQSTSELLRVGRVSVAIRRLAGSYVRTLVYSYASAGQEPAGKVQLDRDQLFARDRFSTDRIFLCVYGSSDLWCP